MSDDEAYACPHCGAVSHNPNDKREQYCGRCHRFADAPAPDDLFLATLVDAARREQGEGEEGWCRGLPKYAGPLQRLLQRGLVKYNGPDWYMPTEAGFALIEIEGHA